MPRKRHVSEIVLRSCIEERSLHRTELGLLLKAIGMATSRFGFIHAWAISHRDPKTLRKAFERANSEFKGLDWELEDLVSDPFFEASLEERPNAVMRVVPVAGKNHRELSRDGKARLHKFVGQYAMRDDLPGVIDLLKALRFYMGLPQSAV